MCSPMIAQSSGQPGNQYAQTGNTMYQAAHQVNSPSQLPNIAPQTAAAANPEMSPQIVNPALSAQQQPLSAGLPSNQANQASNIGRLLGAMRIIN